MGVIPPFFLAFLDAFLFAGLAEGSGAEADTDGAPSCTASAFWGDCPAWAEPQSKKSF